eukprot:1102854-Prymnesium_polylepis.1
MSEWDFLEGNNAKRIGARVIENEKLREPVPPRAERGLHVSHVKFTGRVKRASQIGRCCYVMEIRVYFA